MTRELEATAVLTAAQLPLVALHRALPHVAGCPRCGPALLVGDGIPCLRGRALLTEAHGWRDRSRA